LKTCYICAQEEERFILGSFESGHIKSLHSQR
jgi:hypothetical protein